jgi:hypothetical protein
MSNPLRFQIERSLYRKKIELRAAFTTDGGQIAVLGSPTLTEIGPNQIGPDEPLLTLTDNEATALIDELWRAGVRPSEHGSAGQLAATERHLADMRRLVFTARSASDVPA